MKIRLGLISSATSMLLLAAVTGCGSDASSPTPAPTQPTSPSATTPPPTPSPTTSSEAAQAAATSTVSNYFAVLDQVLANPASDIKALATVATSSQLAAMRTFVQSQRTRGQHQTGQTRIADLVVQSVSLDNSAPSSGKVPTVVIDVCWDVSEVDVVDASGKSVVAKDRPNTSWTRYGVANYNYAADSSGGWRIATGQDLKKAPCEAS